MWVVVWFVVNCKRLALKVQIWRVRHTQWLWQTVCDVPVCSLDEMFCALVTSWVTGFRGRHMCATKQEQEIVTCSQAALGF